MVATALGIVREEGSLKLWQGVTPALYRHVVYRYLNFQKKTKIKVFLFEFITI